MKKLLLLMLAMVMLLSGCGMKKEAAAGGLTCTLSISCANLVDSDVLAEAKRPLVPDSGWLLEPVECSFGEGESVFDVFNRVVRENKIHMEFVETPAYNSVYIEGIGNLYEFDGGPQSGWMYCVNGEFPNYGCSTVKLQDGDVVEWVYTLDLGNDVGGSMAGK